MLKKLMILTIGWLLIALPSQSQPRFGGKFTKPALGKKPGGPALQGMSKEKKEKFAKANPEDITNENFPDLIESFDYPNADITDVVKAISELTGKNFIVDPQVRGKVTIIAPSQITVAEAYRAFLSALAINGYTVVPSGSFLKIKTARNAQRDSIETYAGEYFPNTDQMITRIIKLKYISAEEVNKQLRILPSKDGEMVPYSPTNSIIISDYGSNIERVVNIINQLDVPGFEEKLVVIRIRYAKASDIADLLDQIINKGEKKATGRGVPRFRRGAKKTDGGTAGSESFSLVIPDERTNSIIVVGNKAGIDRVRRLVSKLDFKLAPDESGGVFVYYVRHGDAEEIADTLNGIASEAKKNTPSTGGTKSTPGNTKGNTTGNTNPLSGSGSIFKENVIITADKNTNSLIITASKQDYEVVRNLLSKIDIARDQVYVKAVIMEMNTSKQASWGIDYYSFNKDSNGIGRIGFRSGSINDLLDPRNDQGAILGFGSGDTFEFQSPDGSITATVSSLVGLVKFLKSNTGANILSTPQIMVLDNEEGEIEVGETLPVSRSTTTSTAGTDTSSIQREKVTIKLNIKPAISPDTDTVKMEIDQQVKQLSKTRVIASELANAAIATTERNIKTQIVVNSGDTAVLGGLMADQDDLEIVKVPILGDIPIIGWLFKSKKVEKRKTNLLVFITPKIIRNMQDNAELLDEKLNRRIDFIQRFMNGRDPYGDAVERLPRRVRAAELGAGASQGNPVLDEPEDSGENFEQFEEPDDGETNFVEPEDSNNEEPAVETF